MALSLFEPFIFSRGSNRTQLWTMFTYPTESGPKPAFAVPTGVGSLLVSTYTFLLIISAARLWDLVVSILVASIVKPDRQARRPTFTRMILGALWNKKGAPFAAATEILSIGKIEIQRKDGLQAPKPLICSGIAFIFAVWLGQTALPILVPPLLVLGHAGPVNPLTIYVPAVPNSTKPGEVIATKSLTAQWALRALGSVQQQSGRDQQTIISNPVATNLDTGRPYEQMDYQYTVTGYQLGLQKLQNLSLQVSGSCFTEYGWYQNTANITLGSGSFSEDSYLLPGRTNTSVTVSLRQGGMPLAFFYVLDDRLPGRSLKTSNTTWAAVVSSVGRRSYGSSTDPWYYTEETAASEQDVSGIYTVRSQRPALSCWEDNAWSYQGQHVAVDNLSQAFPVESGMQELINRWLGAPMVVLMGSTLGTYALQSGTSNTGDQFDASESTVYGDMTQLVTAAYIATTNIFADSILYPDDASQKAENMARDVHGHVKPGVADFIIPDANISALSLIVVATIPAIATALWLTAFVLARLPCFSLVGILDPTSLSTELKNGPVNVKREKGRFSVATWWVMPALLTEPVSLTEPVPSTEPVPPGNSDSRYLGLAERTRVVGRGSRLFQLGHTDAVDAADAAAGKMIPAASLGCCRL